MIGTYLAVLAVCVASLALGQSALGLCGIRRWSWLAPAVGLALLCGICWATVRLPGHGTISAIVVLVLTAAAAIYLRGRVEGGGGGGALRAGLPVAAAGLLAASLPFLAEGHFGILGTGFNPDMSQHLLAADRLAHGSGSQLLHQGYPLGPHSIVIALNRGLGIGLVQGFGGLTVSVAVLAPLTALAAFEDQPRLRRTAAALLVGIPYLVASYFAQGAFKETIQALFVLAFVLALRESGSAWRDLPLRFVPAALIAIGSVYAYSFPGLIWLAAILLIWLALTRSLPVRPLLLALVVFAIGVLPELGRMVDFNSFETFDPNGPGLGNLFGQVSPFTALGIWPSGDFRLAPGAGAVPAFAYYLGAAFAAALLVHGLVQCVRRHETTILAGTLAVAVVYAAARAGGTPYTAAKALEIAAPVLTLVILAPIVGSGRLSDPMGQKGAPALYALLAGGCSLLAFANAPVGPTSYSPALTGLRPLLATSSTLFLAPESLLEEEQGARYVAWELRGGRVCIEAEGSAGGKPPTGVRFVITTDGSDRAPFRGLTLSRHAGPYLLWERRGLVRNASDCPLIAVRQARQGP
ncbi:MAG TPA: hypothetical protein VLK89_05310 [Solirubrobacterales bacterium]|nr:hypothetical protein [Solirubrobacterales bacterium]